MIRDYIGNGAGTDLAGRSACGNVDQAVQGAQPFASRVLGRMRRSDRSTRLEGE